jgi:hypothetical protein
LPELLGTFAIPTHRSVAVGYDSKCQQEIYRPPIGNPTIAKCERKIDVPR